MTVMKQLLTVTLAGVVFAAFPARTADAAAPVKKAAAAQADHALKSAIEADLKKNSLLAPRDIDVDVERGVVTLTGSVRDSAEKTRATSVAQIRGVVRVNNRLEIDPNIDRSKIDRAAEKTKEGLNKAVEATAGAVEKTKEGVTKGVTKTEEGVSKAADSVGKASDKASDKVNDAAITTRVKASFSDERLLKESAIDVDTANRVVTLRGRVGSNEARMRAGELASKIDGVVRVNNELVVQ